MDLKALWFVLQGDAAKPRQSRAMRFRQLRHEMLEDRSLMAVVWANQGTASSDTDAFNAYFGSNAAGARAIVNHAISDWNLLVSTPQTITLTITAAPLASNTLGTTSLTGIVAGKPISATIQLDNDGAGSTWYFDATPTSDSEFSTHPDAFSGQSPSITSQDLYTTVAHEIGHAMGFAVGAGLNIDNYLTDIGADPSNPGHRWLRFHNPAMNRINTTLTTYGGGHLVNSNDLLSATNNYGWRKLVSNVDAYVLGDAYGYTITAPGQTDNIYVNQDPVTGNVTVVGKWLTNIDNIAISYITSPARYYFTVNGASESVSTNGNFWMPISVSTGGGNDTVTITSGFTSIDVDGGAGTDKLVYSGGDAFEYEFWVDSDSIFRFYAGMGPNPYLPTTYTGVEEVDVIGGSFTDDVFRVTATGGGVTAITLHGKSGNDLIDASGSSVPIYAFGGGGNDVLIGGAGADLLVGNEGDDALTGNGSRDILIGGSGADSFYNDWSVDNAEDMIITNITDFDNTLSNLLAIRAEWLSSRTQTERLANLQGVGTGTRSNGNIFLTGTTVDVDTAIDQFWLNFGDVALIDPILDSHF